MTCVAADVLHVVCPQPIILNTFHMVSLGLCPASNFFTSCLYSREMLTSGDFVMWWTVIFTVGVPMAISLPIM